jgi:hypothetical protein
VFQNELSFLLLLLIIFSLPPNRLPQNPSFHHSPLHLPPPLTPPLHPSQCARPARHGHTNRNHSPHTPREVRREVRSIEHYAPPRVDGVTAHVHACNDNGTQAVFFIAQHIVGPCKEGRLAGVDAAGPVVHCEVDSRVVWVGEDEGRGYDAGYCYPVADFFDCC